MKHEIDTLVELNERYKKHNGSSIDWMSLWERGEISPDLREEHLMLYNVLDKTETEINDEISKKRRKYFPWVISDNHYRK